MVKRKMTDLLFASRSAYDYGLLVLVYFIAYLYCIPFAVWAAKQPELAVINSAHKDCILGLCLPRVQTVLTATRGKNYIISDRGGTSSARLKSCLITFWSFAHFMLYFILGLLLPHMFLETFVIGVGFEIFEYYKYDCHDALDIFFNTTGFLIGRTVRLRLA
jgi:hypothetical protein